MNTHEDNIRELVVEYLEHEKMPEVLIDEVIAGVDKEEIDQWLQQKTKTFINEILYVWT